jgi:pimeloyl-ACP methyl ester carboxylesterase
MSHQDIYLRQPADVTLHLRKWGSGECALVLLHGFGEGSYVWNHIAPQLTRHGCVLALDFRGHGDSDPDPQGRYALASHVADATFAMNYFDLRNVILVGHSFGARIAIDLMAAQSNRVRGLVLVDGGPDLDAASIAHIQSQFVSQPWRYGRIEDYICHLEGAYPVAQRTLLAQMAPNALRDDEEGGYRLKCDAKLGESQETGNDLALWRTLASLSQPLLVLRGSASAVLPRGIAKKMTVELKNCTLRNIPGAGHAIMFDNPTAFVTAMTGFIAHLREMDSGRAGKSAEPE